MWVTRNKTGELNLWNDKPYRYNPIVFSSDNVMNYTVWKCDTEMAKGIDTNIFPNLKWEDEPLEIKLLSDDRYEELLTCEDIIATKAYEIKSEDEPIYMLAYSEQCNRFWWNDKNYAPNPLAKYNIDSKLWDIKIKYASEKTAGVEYIAVKTTMYTLELLGWTEDYEKYKTCETKFNSL